MSRIPVKSFNSLHLSALLFCISQASAIFIPNELKNVTEGKVPTPAEWTETLDDGIWSSLLEEWTLTNK
jgi:hypothetical protein